MIAIPATSRQELKNEGKCSNNSMFVTNLSFWLIASYVRVKYINYQTERIIRQLPEENEWAKQS